LNETSQNIQFTGGSIQVIIGEFAPLGFGFASNLLPITFQDILIHMRILLDPLKKLSHFMPALGAAKCAGILSPQNNLGDIT